MKIIPVLIGLEMREKKMSDVLKTEYSDAFDEKRKRLIEQSYYKYGPARRNFATGNVDAIGCSSNDYWRNSKIPSRQQHCSCVKKHA